MKDQTVLVGSTAYEGNVMAASAWGKEGTVEPVRPALSGSFTAPFHETGAGNFLLPLMAKANLS